MAIAIKVPHRHGHGGSAGIEGQRGEETRHNPGLQALQQQVPERAAATAGGGWGTHRQAPST